MRLPPKMIVVPRKACVDYDENRLQIKPESLIVGDVVEKEEDDCIGFGCGYDAYLHKGKTMLDVDIFQPFESNSIIVRPMYTVDDKVYLGYKEIKDCESDDSWLLDAKHTYQERVSIASVKCQSTIAIQQHL